MVLIIFVTTLILLFILGYLTKRRFGILGLGLAAGSVLASSFSGFIDDLMTAAGVTVEGLVNSSVARCILILLPPIILLLSGPKYHKKSHRIIGSLLFTLLAGVFLFAPLSASIVTTVNLRDIMITLAQNQSIIIGGGIGLALIDVLLARGSKATIPENAKH